MLVFAEIILNDKPKQTDSLHAIFFFFFRQMCSPFVGFLQKRKCFKGSVWRIMMHESVTESLGATEQARCLVTSLNTSALQYEVKLTCLCQKITYFYPLLCLTSYHSGVLQQIYCPTKLERYYMCGYFWSLISSFDKKKDKYT